jgi:BirA family biotin operon repressor/biotin-[acetyl-CoA-carboxylase] ligase
LPLPVDPKPTPAAARGGEFVPLDAARLAAAASRFECEAVLETGSTNTDLLQRVRISPPAKPLLRATAHQSAGRGRHGRRWFSDPGSALLFSLAVPMTAGGDRIAAATLACGIGVAEALRAAGAPATLKWPNDVMLDGRKLGGVLCELATDAAGRRTVVVGVGINLHVGAAMGDSIGRPVASLDETPAVKAPREALIASMATAVLDTLLVYDAHGFVPLQPRFMALFGQRNATVDLLELGVRVASGRALGVDGQGRLLIETPQGPRAFSSGELSPGGAT